MDFTTDMVKELWHEPLYDEIIKLCKFFVTYTPTSKYNIMNGEDLDIGQNTELIITYNSDFKNSITVAVYSKEPFNLKYIFFKNKDNHYIVDKNYLLVNSKPYGTYWYDSWKNTKNPIWVDLKSMRQCIEDYLIDINDEEYMSELDIGEYITIENNILFSIPHKKIYNLQYYITMWNIRNTNLEKYFVKSFPLLD
jgi:hypothetical protein